MSLPYVLGHNARISLGGSNIAHSTSCKVTLNKENKKINHKDIDPGSEGGGFSSAVGGVKSLSGSAEFFIYKTGSSFAALTAAWKADTEMDFLLSGGGMPQTITCHIKVFGIDITADDGEVVKANISFESTDEIVFT